MSWAALDGGVRRLLFLGSSCIYPKFAAQPILEASLMTGELEATNDAYAVAKIAGIKHVQALRRQYAVNYISAMPTNLYGPGDNFNPTKSHVLPALIRRIHEAKSANADTVTIWGSGTPRREFLFVDDLADALLFLLEHYDYEPINVGVGADISIRDLAGTIAEVVGWQGEFLFELHEARRHAAQASRRLSPHGPGMEGQHSSQGRDQAHLSVVHRQSIRRPAEVKLRPGNPPGRSDPPDPSFTERSRISSTSESWEESNFRPRSVPLPSMADP